MHFGGFFFDLPFITHLSRCGGAFNYFVYQAGGVSDSTVKSEQRVGSAGWERWQILKMWIGTKFWHA